jgi:hypothetical protein
MTRRIEKVRDKSGKFYLRLFIETKICGTLEFVSIYPKDMTTREADIRIIDIATILGLDWDEIPYSGGG